MTPPRRRPSSDRLFVGIAEGIRVWMEAKRPGLHFAAKGPGYDMGGTWAIHDDRLVLVQLCVTSAMEEDDRRPLERLLDGLLRPAQGRRVPLRASALRSVSIVDLERRTRQALKEAAENEARIELAMEEARRQGIDIPALFEVPRVARGLAGKVGPESFRPGRGGYPTDVYEWVATQYLDLLRAGSRSVLAELARRASERFGRPVSVSTARDWVHRARELGFLTKGSRGRAQAEPGPRLRQRIPSNSST